MSKTLEYPRQAKPVRNGYYDSVRYWSVSKNHESSLVKTEISHILKKKRLLWKLQFSSFTRKVNKVFFFLSKKVSPSNNKITGWNFTLELSSCFMDNRKLFLNQPKRTTVLNRRGTKLTMAIKPKISTYGETVLWNIAKVNRLMCFRIQRYNCSLRRRLYGTCRIFDRPKIRTVSCSVHTEPC